MTDNDKLVEELALALWQNEAVRAAPNILKYRTAEAFAEAGPAERALWLSCARAILPILHRERLAAAEAVREAAAIAYEVEAGTWKQLPQRGSVVRQGGRTIRALDLNAILGGSDE